MDLKSRGCFVILFLLTFLNCSEVREWFYQSKKNLLNHPKLLIVFDGFHVLLEMLENLDLIYFPVSDFVVVDIGELWPQLIPEELVSDSVA
jgi:hypothetical protein